MKKSWVSELDYYFFMPAIVAVVVVALWLTLSAAVENYRLSGMADQLVRMVSLARGLHVSKEAVDFKVHEAFFDQVKSAGEDEVVVVSPSAGVGRPAERGVVLPWGDVGRAAFYPSYLAVRFELPVSASRCRRLLNLYRKDAHDVGLIRVDVRPKQPPAIWRKIYEAQPKGAKEIQDSEIYGGCMAVEDVVLSLTFSL